MGFYLLIIKQKNLTTLTSKNVFISVMYRNPRLFLSQNLMNFNYSVTASYTDEETEAHKYNVLASVKR